MLFFPTVATVLILQSRWLDNTITIILSSPIVGGMITTKHSPHGPPYYEVDGCTEKRCCFEAIFNETKDSLSTYSYTIEKEGENKNSSRPDLCIAYKQTHSSCSIHSHSVLHENENKNSPLHISNSSSATKSTSPIDYYNTTLTGCQIRSVFLERFAPNSVLYFEGDSIMRQLWLRLICMMRDQDVCIDPAWKSCSIYTFNRTHDHFLGPATSWNDIPVNDEDDLRVENGIILSYCFTTSPGLKILDEITAEPSRQSERKNFNVALITFGLFYWKNAGNFETWLDTHKQDVLLSRFQRAKKVMFVERIPSKWKYPTDTNDHVHSFLQNAITNPKDNLGRVPWNDKVAPQRPRDVEPVDALHWMCRWRDGENLVTGGQYQCNDRENRAVIVAFLQEVIELFKA